jgi:hypothetical protein
MSRNNYEIGGSYRLQNNKLIHTNPSPRAIALARSRALSQSRSRATGRFTSFKAAMRKLWRYTKLTITLLALLAFAAFIGYALHGNTITATNQVTIAAPAVIPTFPVLDRIARAESHNSQICTVALVKAHMCHASEVGTTLLRPNTDKNGVYIGNYDIGKYQINSMHLSDALALGYDVYTEAGNRAFAEYLFTTQGSEPWSASKSNW